MTAAAGCGGGGSGGGAGAQPAPREPATCALEALYPAAEDAEPAAAAHLARGPWSTPDEARDALLARLAEQGIDPADTSADEVAQALYTAIDRDLQDGRTTLLDGWVVSSTEADLATSALASQPTSC